jgi:CheY-like chemotaxis protein
MTNAKILIVDDNEFNLKLATALLAKRGITAESALSGQEAIDLIKQNDFDIVFMDHLMPEMDGIEATKLIRELGGKFETLPIIALTANKEEGADEMFLANGFDGFMPKPIKVTDLNETLVKFLTKER